MLHKYLRFDTQKYLEFVWNIWYGIYSNIPWCCTWRYSVLRFKGVWYTGMFTAETRGVPFLHGPEYVQCKSCSDKLFVNELIKGKPNNKLFLWLDKYVKNNRSTQPRTLTEEQCKEIILKYDTFYLETSKQ